MRKDLVKKFKKMFEEQKRTALFNDKILREDFAVSDEERFDEVDQATMDSDQAMRMRLRNREVLFLRKIDEALERIEDGCFGECETCGENIEVKRLMARPTATLCVGCKEEEERKEGLSAKGRIHKSLGQQFSVRTFM